MTGGGLRRPWGLRALAVVALAVVLTAGSFGRPLLAQTPAAPAQADPLLFNLDVPLLLIYQVKPDKTADFESVWDSIKAGLAKSDKADLKSFGEGLKLFKADLPPPAPGAPPQPVIYVFHIDQPSKTISYNPVKLLYESGIFKYEEATPLYEKFKDTYTNIQFWPLKKVGS